MLKKTETIELRLPYETKQAFMARCRTAGVSASAELRAFIADYAARPQKPANRLRLAAPIGLAAGALLAVGVMAEPTLARAGVSASFSQMDANGDGQVSFAEFSRAVAPEAVLQVQGSTIAGARLPADVRERILRDGFARIDRDRDGEISLQEFRDAADRR